MFGHKQKRVEINACLSGAALDELAEAIALRIDNARELRAKDALRALEKDAVFSEYGKDKLFNELFYSWKTDTVACERREDGELEWSLDFYNWVVENTSGDMAEHFTYAGFIEAYSDRLQDLYEEAKAEARIRMEEKEGLLPRPGEEE